jgi:hypothetical protein
MRERPSRVLPEGVVSLNELTPLRLDSRFYYYIGLIAVLVVSIVHRDIRQLCG